MQKTKTPAENQPVPPPSSFNQHWLYNKPDLQRYNVCCIPHVQARTKTVKRTGKDKKGDLRIGSVASAVAHDGHGRQCHHSPLGRPTA